MKTITHPHQHRAGLDRHVADPDTRRPSAPPAHPSARLARDAFDWYQAAALLHDFAAWIEAAVGEHLATAQPAFAAELADPASAYRSPGSAFIVADDGWLVCGTLAVRRHADGTAELKRMYVRPAARGAGHAGRLLTRALDHATAGGAHRIWLETLPGLMDPAIALYRNHGFTVVTDQHRTIDLDGVIVMARDLR